MRKFNEDNWNQFLAQITARFPEPGKALSNFFNSPNIKGRWLKAPASSKLSLHHAYEGGLIDHSIEVYDLMIKTLSAIGYGVSDNYFAIGRAGRAVELVDVLMSALLHDLHKIGDCRGHDWFVPNFLKSGKRSDLIPYETAEGLFRSSTLPDDYHDEVAAKYLVDRCFVNLPQGELSLAMVYTLDKELWGMLSEEAKFAIRHHDGAYGNTRRTLMGKETPLQILLHFADMMSFRTFNKPSLKSDE